MKVAMTMGVGYANYKPTWTCEPAMKAAMTMGVG